MFSDNAKALWIAVSSLILSFVAFVVGVALAGTTHSAATLGFGLENFVDAVSSALVVWRFWPAPEEVLESREKRASIGIAMAFVALGVVVGGVAISNLVKKHEPEDPDTLIALAIPSMIVLSMLAAMKVYLGYRIDSPSLKKDGACSAVGALLALGILIGNGVYKNHDHFWWFDAATAVTLSVVLLASGVITLRKNAADGHPWWTCEFWTTPTIILSQKRRVSLSERMLHAGLKLDNLVGVADGSALDDSSLDGSAPDGSAPDVYEPDVGTPEANLNSGSAGAGAEYAVNPLVGTDARVRRTSMSEV